MAQPLFVSDRHILKAINVPRPFQLEQRHSEAPEEAHRDVVLALAGTDISVPSWELRTAMITKKAT